MDTITCDIKTLIPLKQRSQYTITINYNYTDLLFHISFFVFHFELEKMNFNLCLLFFGVFFPVYFKKHTEQWIILIPVVLITIPSKLYFLWLLVALLTSKSKSYLCFDLKGKLINTNIWTILCTNITYTW